MAITLSAIGFALLFLIPTLCLTTIVAFSTAAWAFILWNGFQYVSRLAPMKSSQPVNIMPAGKTSHRDFTSPDLSDWDALFRNKMGAIKQTSSSNGTKAFTDNTTKDALATNTVSLRVDSPVLVADNKASPDLCNKPLPSSKIHHRDLKTFAEMLTDSQLPIETAS